MTEFTASDDELPLYFDILFNNHCIVNEPFFLDADERRQYSAEELALEVV